MATIRECQGKAMDAKAVANEIYLRHSMSVTEEQVLHAQAWLQEDLKLNETPPATEKKTEEAATSSTTPVQEPVRQPVDTSKVDGSKVDAAPAAVDVEVKPIIPEGVPKIPPVQVIDDLIRRGYRDREDIEAYMKANFNGKAYQEDVREQLRLFRARQPPFDDIPLPPPVRPSSTRSTSPASASTPSTPPVREPVRQPVQQPVDAPVQPQPPVTDASSAPPSAGEATKVALTATELYAYIRPSLAKGVSYTALATSLGRDHGHASVLLLEQVASSVELGRGQKRNALALYPTIEAAYGCQFGAYVQALCRLPLTTNGAFTPAWKSLILCSNPQVSVDGSATTSVDGSASTSTEVAAVEDLEGITTIEQRRTTKIPLFYRLPAPYRTPYRRRLGNMWAPYRRRPSSLLTYLTC